jgi:glycosyltransferase involved in cell wall biosynthesis
MKKVLIITYYWPPGSGAGVQRWLKFSKYLPQTGWEPVILTVDPDYATYPATDNSLEKEIPPDLKIYKTKATDYFRLYSRDKSKIPTAGFAVDEKKGLSGWLTKFIRGNFFIPDPRRGWNRHAFRKACEIIDADNIVNLITTSPPHSTQLIGLKLKKKYPGLKWTADLRDPWTDIYYYNQFHPTFLSRLIDIRYEKAVIESADMIITVGNSLRKMLVSKFNRDPDSVEVITNGYDPEDFSGLASSTPEVFTISYIGTLSDSYPVQGFLNALGILKEKGTDFRLKFTGMVSSGQRDAILDAIDQTKVEFIQYTDHVSALKYLLNSSALLLIIPDHKSSKSIITGKLFEYLASGKPVICLGPADGDAAAIIDECGHGRTFSYSDSRGIAEYLETLVSNPGITEKISPEIYSRKNLVKRVADLLD